MNHQNIIIDTLDIKTCVDNIRQCIELNINKTFELDVYNKDEKNNYYDNYILLYTFFPNVISEIIINYIMNCNFIKCIIYNNFVIFEDKDIHVSFFIENNEINRPVFKSICIESFKTTFKDIKPIYGHAINFCYYYLLSQYGINKCFNQTTLYSNYRHKNACDFIINVINRRTFENELYLFKSIFETYYQQK